jgi:hypothetical protein
VQLGVCKVLTNLFSNEIITLSDVNVGFLSNLIDRFLIKSNGGRKLAIRSLIHNIVYVSRNWVPRRIFSGVLLTAYFKTFFEERDERMDILYSLQHLVDLVETDSGKKETEMEEFFIRSGVSVERNSDEYYVLPPLSLLEPEDDYEPWIYSADLVSGRMWSRDEIEQCVPFSWEECSAGNRNKLMGLIPFEQKLWLVWSCKFDSFGDLFFEQIDEGLSHIGKWDELIKSLTLICHVLVMAIQKCEEFAVKLDDSKLYSRLANYSHVPEVVTVFSEMCYLSQDFAKHVLDLGVYKNILPICKVRSDDCRSLSVRKFLFAPSSVKCCMFSNLSNEQIKEMIRFALSIRPPVEDEDTFKRWVSRMSEMFHHKTVVSLLGLNEEILIELRSEFSSFLEKICSELKSSNYVIVRGILRLLLSITFSKLIDNVTATRLMILIFFQQKSLR